MCTADVYWRLICSHTHPFLAFPSPQSDPCPISKPLRAQREKRILVFWICSHWSAAVELTLLQKLKTAKNPTMQSNCGILSRFESIFPPCSPFGEQYQTNNINIPKNTPDYWTDYLIMVQYSVQWLWKFKVLAAHDQKCNDTKME